jgi:hypothetical protein
MQLLRGPLLLRGGLIGGVPLGLPKQVTGLAAGLGGDLLGLVGGGLGDLATGRTGVLADI